MPTDMVTFVQATYALAAFVHITNISAVTGPILTKLFGTPFFGDIFVVLNVLGPNFIRHTFFLNPKFFYGSNFFFWPKSFFKQFFPTKIFFGSNLFLDANFFSEPKFFQEFFSFPNFFFINRTQSILGPEHFLDSQFYWT